MSANEKKPDFDEELLQEAQKWREKFKIQDDDVILPLLDLFRIHQNHWDELRRRQMPSLDQFRGEAAAVTECVGKFADKLDKLISLLATHPAAAAKKTIPLSEALYAASAALLAGLLIGMAIGGFQP
jgi:hypothetical protein